MPVNTYSRVRKWRHFERIKKKASVQVEDSRENSLENGHSDRDKSTVSEVIFFSKDNEVNTSEETIVPPMLSAIDTSNDHGDFGDDADVSGDVGGDVEDAIGNPNNELNEDLEGRDMSTIDRSEPIGMEQKIHSWAVKHRKDMIALAITDLLLILRTEGYQSFPKTAETFLGTTHCRKLRNMPGIKKSMGEFIYLGISTGLKNVISSDIYREEKISLLIHIDGMQVYRNSKKEIWPIAVKVYHPNYVTKPFVAAIYCGDAKPSSVEEFMSDFVEESNELEENGVWIDGKWYAVEVLAIVADSPARAFLKGCKAPGAFCACERCVTRGVTVGRGSQGKRIYPETNAGVRTKQSYELRLQPEHHHEGCVSPLLSMNNFDLIKQVPLDVMHLFYSNNMKWLLERWTKRSSAQRIKLADLRRLDVIMKKLKGDIPCEFQRNIFDVFNIARWKASQFKFFLNYCGIIVFQKILPKPLYRHFSLLVFASRILNSKELIVDYSGYAGLLLKHTFETLPLVYNDEGAQVLSWHNILHVADDAVHFKIPLNELSAFWGESYIGLFKRFVHSATKALTQITNRLGELECGERMKIEKRHILSDWCICKSPRMMKIHDEEYVTSSTMKIHGLTLTTKHPNNVVLMDNGKVFIISKLLVKPGKPQVSDNLNGIYIVGQEESSRDEAFGYPDSSINVGIILVKEFSGRMQCQRAIKIKHKCALLNVAERQYAITLLHE